MSKGAWRVTRVVDLVADKEGDLYAPDLFLNPFNEPYQTPEELGKADGFSVEYVPTPLDPVGTVRKYDMSENVVIKRSSGKWHYISPGPYNVGGGSYRFGDEVPNEELLLRCSKVVTKL